MVDTQYLEQVVNVSGLKREYIADRMHITRQSLSNKIAGKSDFYSKEILDICDVLGLSVNERNRIFFAKNVTENGD